MHDLWNMCMCSKTKQNTVQNCTKKKYEFESFFSSAVHFVRFCFNTSEVWVHLCTWIYFIFFFVADRCHTPICRCDRNHILENILIVEKKNQQRKWTSVRVAQEILLPNVLHILEKIVPCKTYSSSIFHWRSKKKSWYKPNGKNASICVEWQKPNIFARLVCGTFAPTIKMKTLFSFSFNLKKNKDLYFRNSLL